MDLDSQSLVELIIQLRDEDENTLEMEGVEIEIEVESTDILVQAAETDNSSNAPDPYYEDVRGGDDSSTVTLLTDRDGEAVFELDAPRRYDRLDEVFIIPDCDCEAETITVAWSAADSVLVAAEPEFDLYRDRDGDDIRFTVEYNLYDQYGTALRNTKVSQTGRAGTTLEANLKYQLYSRRTSGATSVTMVPDTVVADDMTITRGRITEPVDLTVPLIYREDAGFLILLEPSIFSNSSSGDNMDDDGDDPNEVNYVASPEVVWIVEDAASPGDFPESCNLTGVDVVLKGLEVNIDEREFRTCFTVWGYDSNDRFIGPDGTITIVEFENLLLEANTGRYKGVTVFSPLLGTQCVPNRLTRVDGVCPLMTDPDSWDSYIEGGVDIAVPTVANWETPAETRDLLDQWDRWLD